jgi:glycosyltransferase involved in cell wall biosynthesis
MNAEPAPAPMRLLFISRTFPPVVGGIERHNDEIARALGAICNVRVIANRRGKYLLPLFLPWATLRALLLLPRLDAVLLGDGVLGITGFILKLFSRKPVICIVHGLDLTYPHPVYQRFWVRTFLPRMDRLIAVGNATRAEGVRRGIPPARLVYIPNGVSAPPAPRQDCARDDLAALIGRTPRRSVLLTLGRLVRRKGVAWFVEKVIPLLDTDITYIVAGTGPEQAHIAATIRAHGLEDRVVLIGGVTETDKELLFCTADLFIQPNIPVGGDIEGFGIVVLEAAVRELVVVASRLEGLADAISDGVNGYLVDPGNAREYCTRITALLADRTARQAFGRHAGSHTVHHHGWPLIAERYLHVISRAAGLPGNATAAG